MARTKLYFVRVSVVFGSTEAAVPVQANSEEPFFCLTCANLRLKQEVILLMNELKEMAETRDRCSALANEVLICLYGKLWSP